MKQELETVGFLLGFVVFIAGVAMFSVPVAFIVGGLVIAGVSVALALARSQKRRDS